MAQMNVNVMDEEKEMKRNERALNTGAAKPQGTLKDSAMKAAQNNFTSAKAKFGQGNSAGGAANHTALSDLLNRMQKSTPNGMQALPASQQTQANWGDLLRKSGLLGAQGAADNRKTNGVAMPAVNTLAGNPVTPALTNYANNAANITPTNPAGSFENSGATTNDATEQNQGLDLTDEQKAMISNPGEQDDVVVSENERKTAEGVAEYVKTNGQVAVRDYVTSRGIPADIQWNGETGEVSINGISFKPTAIVDGKAYMPQSQLDEILKVVDKRSGLKSDSDILAESEEKYGGRVIDAFNKYMDYGDFSYSAKNDQAFQEFMDAYKKGVQDEYQKTMAQARFRTGGVPSSAVMQQAANIRESALDDSAKYRQQYEDRAYQKWQDGYKNAYNELMTANGMMNDYYNLHSGSNDKMVDAWYKSQDFDVLNQQNKNAVLRGNMETEQYLKYYPDVARYAWENAGYEADNNRINNEITRAFGYDTARQKLTAAEIANIAAILGIKLDERKFGVSTGVTWADMMKRAGLI